MTPFTRPENKYRQPLETKIVSPRLVTESRPSPQGTPGSPSPPCIPISRDVLVIQQGEIKVSTHTHTCASSRCVCVCVSAQEPVFQDNPPSSLLLHVLLKAFLLDDIHTRHISQHQHLAPGFSYEQSSCRSFCRPPSPPPPHSPLLSHRSQPSGPHPR